MYKITATASVPMIPNGMFFCGCLTSAAELDTTSKPRKAKKTVVAPLKTPAILYGKKG